MTDSYHTIGAQRDRERTWSYLGRIALALEKIAERLEVTVVEELTIGPNDGESSPGGDGYDE